MASPNLDIRDLAARQANKETVVNEAVSALDQAGNDTVDVSVTGADPADVQVLAAVFTRNVRLRLAPGAAAPVAAAGRFFHLAIPVSKRVFALTNSTAVEARLKITGAADAATDPKIPAGQSGLFYSDGTAIVSLSGVIAYEDEAAPLSGPIRGIRFKGAGVAAAIAADGFLEVTIP